MRARFGAASLIPLLVVAACSKSSTAANDTTAASSTSTTTTSSTAAATAATDTAGVRKTIEDADAKWAAAENRGDANAVATNYADSVVTMYAGQPTTRGRAAVTKVLADEFAKNKQSNTVFHTDEVMVNGNVAVETGTYSSTIAPAGGGKPVAHAGRYMTVWQKQPDGTWKVVRDMDAESAAPTKPAAP